MPQLPPRMPDRPRPTRRTSPVSRETPASPSASSQASAVPSDVSDQPEALLQPARALAELLVPGDHESVERAISALAHFAFASTEPVSMLHRHDALDCAGAFANLINVLSAHREHAGIFGTACSILGSLRVDRLESLKNAPEGGVVAVVQGLQVHKEDYRVCRHGVRALAGFTRLDDVRARLLHRYDGISTVVECMQLHGEVESLYLDSMQFLSFASLHSETNKTEISRGGALRKCLDCLSKWPANRVLHTHVCVIIRNVTVNRPDIIATAEQMQCVESLLDSINTHGNNAVLTTHALAALHHLTTSQEATRRLLRHPTWESTLIDTAKRHASRPTIQALALDVAARVVTAGGPLAARRLVRVGAVKVAIVAMHRFVNRRAVLYCGSRLTRMLLMSGGGSEDVRQCGGVERLLDLLYCTVVAPVSADERYAGYADVLSEAVA